MREVSIIESVRPAIQEKREVIIAQRPVFQIVDVARERNLVGEGPDHKIPVPETALEIEQRPGELGQIRLLDSIEILQSHIGGCHPDGIEHIYVGPFDRCRQIERRYPYIVIRIFYTEIRIGTDLGGKVELRPRERI